MGKVSMWARLLAVAGFAQASAAEPADTETRVVEAASSQSEDEAGWRRLTGDGLSKYNDRDLTPIAQDRMAKLAEWLWQSNLLANRLVEIPLAYLVAEGVSLQCKDPAHQKLLDAFWNDPINNWPLKLPARVRALALLGEQCYITRVNAGSGFVRLGYLDPRSIGTVVMDPDNPEQPIGVITKRDVHGKYWKYRVVVLGEDADLFTERTTKIRTEDFVDGECMLYQVNKFPDGSRGRSDLLGQMDWLDAYDEFLFNELDRIGYLRSFVWDVTLKGSDDDAVKKFDREFKAPEANSKFVHNESVELKAVSPELQAADTAESARLLRNHVLGGATVPEHWFGGGGDVNRAAASEMGEPTFKVYTARQSMLKLMLEEIGRFVLWKSLRTGAPDWGDEKWKVTAVFPELANKDLTKFAAAMSQVSTSVILMIDNGLLTQERGLQLIADIAGRFGQEIDAAAELEKARAEHEDRGKKKAAADSFNLPDDLRQALKDGKAKPAVTDDAAAGA
ncbi:hypothetical protein [Ramlibacter sp.]|uniref:hypothetical protein n=1 Tax=Ramlibacter sp. TaxID=1917967 RepID=UPI003D0C2BD0